MTGRTRRLSAAVVILGFVAPSWVGWQYYRMSTCAELMCPASATERPIILPSGVTLPVIDFHIAEDGTATIEYATAANRRSMSELCAEAKAVWSSVHDWPRLRGTAVVHLGPTSAHGEFIGLRWLVVPSYLCCVSTYLTVEKSVTGEWRFHQTGCEK